MLSSFSSSLSSDVSSAFAPSPAGLLVGRNTSGSGLLVGRISFTSSFVLKSGGADPLKSFSKVSPSNSFCQPP